MGFAGTRSRPQSPATDPQRIRGRRVPCASPHGPAVPPAGTGDGISVTMMLS